MQDEETKMCDFTLLVAECKPMDTQTRINTDLFADRIK